jgi:hypothetical protein
MKYCDVETLINGNRAKPKENIRIDLEEELFWRIPKWQNKQLLLCHPNPNIVSYL